MLGTKNLYIAIETQSRELEGNSLLAVLAAVRGYRVVIGHKSRLLRFAHRLPPGFYLEKSAALTKESDFAYLRRLGHRVVVADEEGLVVLSPEVYCRQRVSGRSLQLLDHMFVWGAEQKEALETHYPELRQKYVLAGNPRMDLLREELRQFHQIRT